MEARELTWKRAVPRAGIYPAHKFKQGAQYKVASASARFSPNSWSSLFPSPRLIFFYFPDQDPQNMVLFSFFHSTQCPWDKVQVPQARLKGLCNLDPLRKLQPHLSLLKTGCPAPAGPTPPFSQKTALESPAPKPLLMLTHFLAPEVA